LSNNHLIGLHLHLHLSHLAGALIQSDLQIGLVLGLINIAADSAG
jgi:hypothetical protein